MKAFEQLDIVQILSLGAIGLGFLLAFLSYRLIAKEQKRTDARSNVLKATYIFMGFSAFLVILGIVGKYLDQREYAALSTLRLEHDFEKIKDKFSFGITDQFRSGAIGGGDEAVLDMDVPENKCRPALAMTLPGHDISVKTIGSGPGANSLDIQSSGSGHFERIVACAGSLPATVTIAVKVSKDKNEYRIESFLLPDGDQVSVSGRQ